MINPAWTKAVAKRLALYEAAKASVRLEKTKLAELAELEKDLAEATGIAQRVAQGVQHQAHRRIARIVTRALEAVFEDPYVFKILFERKRSKTEAQLVFERDGVQVADPLDSASGGVADVAAFALRVACLVLSTPPKRRFLALDEAFKNVRAHNRPAVRRMVEALATELGLQVLMITNSDALRCGKVIDLTPKGT